MSFRNLDLALGSRAVVLPEPTRSRGSAHQRVWGMAKQTLSLEDLVHLAAGGRFELYWYGPGAQGLAPQQPALGGPRGARALTGEVAA